MPIYEYRCVDCGKTFEAIQKFSAEPFILCGQSSVECESGGQGKVERLMSSPSFQFKGSGWYVTDYAKAGTGSKSEAKPEAKKEAKPEAKSETKSEPKSDTKPAASSPKD